MYWHTTPYALVLFLSALMTAGISWAAWQRRATPGGRIFALLMAAVAFWSLAAFFEASVVQIPFKIFWSKASYLGAASTPTLFLLFAFEFSRWDRRLPRQVRLFLWVIPVVTLGVAWTNELHGMLWNSFSPSPLPDSNLLIYGHGPWFWVAMLYFYLSVFAGSLALVWSVIRFPQMYRGQAVLLAAGSLTPWIGILINIFGYSPIQGMDFTPVAFGLSGLVLGVSIFRFHLFDLVPVARDLLIDKMGDGVMVLDTQQRIIDINPAAQRMMGLSATEAIGQRVEKLFEAWPDIRSASLQTLVSAVQTRQPPQVTLIVGSLAPRYFDLSLTNIQDRSARFSGTMLTLREITSQHQAQDEIRRLKEFNESIVQHLTEGIVLEDTEGLFIYVNPAAAAMLGYSAIELLGQQTSIIIPDDQRFKVEDAKSRRRQGLSDRYELDLQHKDGRRIPVLVSANPQYDSVTGDFTGSQAVFTNLTDFKRAESDLADARALLDAAFEQTPLPMVLVSVPDGTLRIVNTAAREYLGVKDEPDYVGRPYQEMGQSWQDIDPEGNPVPLAKLPLFRAMQGVTTRNTEYGLIRKDGTRRWELISAAPVYNKQGQQIAAFVVFPDITERKRIEEAEHDQRLLLEALRDITAALNSTLNLDEVLDRILADIGKVVPHDAANIALVDEHGEAHVVRSSGYGENGTNELLLSVQMGLDNLPNLRKMVETGEPTVVPDTLENLADIQVPIPAIIRSSAGAPILVKGQVAGFINLDSATPSYFTQEHADRLRAFADQAAIAIENARLFKETSQRAEQLAMLNRVGISITAGLDVEQVVRTLFDQCRLVFQIDCFYLALYDELDSTIHFPLFWDDDKFRQLEPHNLASDPGLTGYVIHHRQSVYLADTLDPTIELPAPIIRTGSKHARSYIGTPLILRDKVVGVLSVQNYQPAMYTSEQVRLLETIAAQAVIAIENARLFEQMEKLAITDSLSGIFTRRHFFTLATQEIERAARYNQDLSALMIDLDHFKTINDTFGHQVGDRVLQSVAQNCSQALRKVDVMGRYGGEEFVIILPETNLESAQIVAERLRQIVAGLEIQSGGEVVQITACFGVAGLENCAADVDILLDCADKALYAAKQGGRNQVGVYRGGLFPASEEANV